MSELKPCPHCGSLVALQILDQNEVDFIDRDNENWSDEPYYQVVCSVNEDSQAPIADWKPGCGSASGFFPTKEGAITAWNLRSQPENKPLTLDELREMDGEPAWIDDWYQDFHGWELSCDASDYLAERDVSQYGSAWIAYHYNPEMIRQP